MAVDPAPRASGWLIGLVMLLFGWAWASVHDAAAGLAEQIAERIRRFFSR